MPSSHTYFPTLRAVASAAALAALWPAAAAAESPITSHARAAGLDWIARVPAERLTAVEQRPAICLVDTGVAVTPDTPATSPAGPIVARLSVYEDDGTAAGPAMAQMHGTMMAAAIAAPANGWGTVGIWPGARIVSVRASAPEGGLDSAAITRAITLCRQWSVDTGQPLAAVNLSLGQRGYDPALEVRMNNRVEAMRVDSNVTFVSSAGNDPTKGTSWPASTPGVLAVGAGTLSGGWCPTASHDALTDLVAPGCDVTAGELSTGEEGIWPDAGSSHASAVVSAVVAALRSLRPDASAAQVEQWLTSSGAVLDGARVLDGRAIAAAAGVADLAVDAPEPPAPAPQRVAPLAGPTLPSAPRRLRVKRAGTSVVVSTAARSGMRLQVAVRARGRWIRGEGRSSVKLRKAGKPQRIWMRWTAPGSTPAPWTSFGRPRSTAARYWQKHRARSLRPPLGDTRP